MSRTRTTTSGAFDESYQWFTQSIIPPGSPTVLYTTYGGYQRIKSITDVETPHFGALVACGKFLPINPVTIRTEEEWRHPWSGSHDTIRDSDGALLATTYGSYVTVPTYAISVPPIDDSIVNLVMVNAMANAASFDWDVLTFLAELHKSVFAIASIGRAFNSFTLSLAIAARRAKRNPYAEFRKYWLGARYTIRPMMYDALNAIQAFSDKLGSSDILKGRGSHTVSDSDSKVTVTGTSGQVTQTDFLEWQRTYRAFVYLGLKDTFWHRFGLDPLQTAWELVPYSFVVDWFIGIGRYLTTVAPTLQGQWLGRGVSVQSIITREAYIDVLWQPPGTGGHHEVGTAGGGYRKTVVKEYVRYAYDSIPYPAWNPRLTLPKLIDLVALFVGGRKRVHHVLSRR